MAIEKIRISIQDFSDTVYKREYYIKLYEPWEFYVFTRLCDLVGVGYCLTLAPMTEVIESEPGKIIKSAMEIIVTAHKSAIRELSKAWNSIDKESMKSSLDGWVEASVKVDK